MKQLVRDWRKVLSLLLIVALVLQISPVQAFAVGQDESVIEQTETIADATEEPAPEATVIGEVEGKREEDVKHFLNSDGSFTAVKYAEPVHYRQTDEAEWVDIDNTLSMRSGSYTPASSPLDVSFADSFGDRTVSVRSQGHELSWSYLRPDAEITPPDIVETQELTPAEGTDTQALKPIEDADISIKAQKLELAAEKAEECVDYFKAECTHQKENFRYVTMCFRLAEAYTALGNAPEAEHTYRIVAENGKNLYIAKEAAQRLTPEQ